MTDKNLKVNDEVVLHTVVCVLWCDKFTIFCLLVGKKQDHMLPSV